MTKCLNLVVIALLLCACTTKETTFRDLEVDFISNLGPTPIFSWKGETGARESSQLAYQILVSDHPELSSMLSGPVWDSEIVQGSSSLQIGYDGPELESGKRYYATCKTWDRQGGQSGWSEVVPFLVPLTFPGDWTSQWLSYDYKEEAPLPLFRKTFELKEVNEINYAVFYVAAPGYYEAYLNGKKIGENVLDPGQTNYEDYTYYTAYELDPQELSGKNAIGIMLGNGWYNQNQVWKGQEEYSNMVYGQPVFTAQLLVHRNDGSRELIGSDDSWRWTSGPITYSNLYGGEHYDARLELENWCMPGNPEGEWFPPESPAVHPTKLLEQFAEPIRIMDTLRVQEILKHSDGSYIFDFGQNIAGWMELTVEGEAGQEISIQCTEILDQDGNLDPTTTGIRATGVIQTQKYLCKGEGVEIWHPRFTYFGFRYAQVSGLKQAPGEDFLTAHVLYSSVTEAGDFTCSEPNINRLHELSRWTILGNIHSIPTDCPHREKCGWTGDSHAMIQPMIYNWDAQRFFEKYLFDIRSSARVVQEELYFGRNFHDRSIVTKPAGVPTMIVPGKRTSGCATPDWGTALVQIPWYLYLYYGDQLMLEDFYPDMKVWVEYVGNMKEDGIIPHGLGDWCPPGGNSNIDCPVAFSSSAFHILDVSLMEKVAVILGETEDREYYSELLDQLKGDFNRHFFDPEAGSYGSSQTANIMALDMGIVPEGKENKVAFAILQNIREAYDGFLNTGIFGLARVFKVLSENGYEPEVYRLLSKRGDNSFAQMWDRFDATTLWEQLPTREEFGATYRSSMNHPMQAGFDAWFYSGIAGINPTPEGPGFQKIIFKPYLTRQMESASASYISKSGPIGSSWERGNETFSWKISIPENSTGFIYAPTHGTGKEVMLNGVALESASEENGFSMVGEFGPGEYLVEFSL